VIHTESLGKQPILRAHHVDVTVAGKFRVHPVAWLARFAVTDPSGNTMKLRRIERLIFPK